MNVVMRKPQPSAGRLLAAGLVSWHPSRQQQGFDYDPQGSITQTEGIYPKPYLHFPIRKPSRGVVGSQKPGTSGTPTARPELFRCFWQPLRPFGGPEGPRVRLPIHWNWTHTPHWSEEVNTKILAGTRNSICAAYP